MMQLLPDRVPWYVVGPLIGLLVASFYAIANRPLGASGAYMEVATFVRDRRRADMWRVWYFVGLVAGALIAALLRGGPSLNLAYGSLGRLVPLGTLIPLLILGGVLMGYGARWAGGCTSGHGLCGTSVRSPGSFVATASFMITAIAVTALLHILTGGLL